MITRVLVVLLTVIVSLCSGSNFSGPRDITRTEGDNQVVIPCQSHRVQATPFWKINDTIYYYSDVPPPFIASRNGRDIIIPVVGSTLNGTSFQCFVPSSSGYGLISSSTGLLTVITNGHLNVPDSNDPQSKIVLMHQNLAFSSNAIVVPWRALREKRCIYYQLAARQSCDLNSNTMVLINRTKEETIILEPEILSNFTYFHLTAFDERGNQYEELFLETFQFGPGTVTEDISLCMDEISDSCSPTPTCIEVPALNGGQTLVLALPFLSITTGSEEDLLCPVHPLLGERCVDLLSCNHFRESAYADSITICRRANDYSGLEMCFHNVHGVMNGTRLHFFYSNLHYCPNGIRSESSRTYIKSMQLVVINPADTYIPTTSLPPQSAETTTITLTTTLFSVGLILTFICGLFLGACGSCVVYCSFQKWKRSNHKGKEMNIAVTSNPAYEVVHLTH